MDQIVALLRSGDLPLLAHHRHLEGWEVAPESVEYSLLRSSWTEGNFKHFSRLPFLKRWSMSPDGTLIPFGRTLPERVLPALPWQSLSSVLPVLPAAVRSTEYFFELLPFSLVASVEEVASVAMTLSLDHFAAWAETAGAPRLNILSFAISNGGESLVVGNPLPPLVGQSYYQQGRLLIPCGWALPPHIWHEHLSSVLEASQNHFVLIRPEGQVEIIAKELCLPASRAAIRLTHQSLS